MKANKPPIFVGREAEICRLNNIIKHKQSAILIVYGRRRIGKTALLEHVFTKRNLIKIEGLEKGGIKVQIKSALQQVPARDRMRR